MSWSFLSKKPKLVVPALLPKWEYKIVIEGAGGTGHTNAADLDGYGSSGWELVAVKPNYSGHTRVFYFKRQK